MLKELSYGIQYIPTVETGGGRDEQVLRVWQFLVNGCWSFGMSAYDLRQLKTFATTFRIENEKLYRQMRDKQL